jgi:hypothetical protein
VVEDWQPVLDAADLKWAGSEFAVLRGERARQALVVLQPTAAKSAVHMLFDRWSNDRDSHDLTCAQRIADEAVATMRETGLSDRELGGELSKMLSRVGFLKSFDDALLDDARTALEDALCVGAADGWVTKWNLANIAARQGDPDKATAYLSEVRADLEDWRGNAFVLVFVPGRAAADSWCMWPIRPSKRCCTYSAPSSRPALTIGTSWLPSLNAAELPETRARRKRPTGWLKRSRRRRSGWIKRSKRTSSREVRLAGREQGESTSPSWVWGSGGLFMRAPPSNPVPPCGRGH